jgi:CheY-like chemotaxis protein
MVRVRTSRRQRPAAVTFDSVTDVNGHAIDATGLSRSNLAFSIAAHPKTVVQNALATDREKCRAAGMNTYLSKPIDRKQLVRIPAMADSGSGHDGQPRSEAT